MLEDMPTADVIILKVPSLICFYQFFSVLFHLQKQSQTKPYIVP